MRRTIPVGLRRGFYAGGYVGSRAQGPYVAADCVRHAQRNPARPLVADGRVTQVAVGPRSRLRGGHHRAERSEGERQRRPRGRRQVDQQIEGAARHQGGQGARGAGSVQDAEPP